MQASGQRAPALPGRWAFWNSWQKFYFNVRCPCHLCALWTLCSLDRREKGLLGLKSRGRGGRHDGAGERVGWRWGLSGRDPAQRGPDIRLRSLLPQSTLQAPRLPGSQAPSPSCLRLSAPRRRNYIVSGAWLTERLSSSHWATAAPPLLSLLWFHIVLALGPPRDKALCV